KLKTVPAAGGPARELCVETGLGQGGTWNRDGVILFGSDTGPLRKVNSTGGGCADVTKREAKVSTRLPEFLPDGKHFLYVGEVMGNAGSRGVYAASLDEAVSDGIPGKKVLDDFSSALFSPTAGNLGQVLFLRGSTLMAQRFDASKLETIGDPISVASQASTSFTIPQLAAGVASNGTLAYLANRSLNYQLTWIDRTGRQRTKMGPAADNRGVAISPDGKLATVSRRDEGLRLYDLSRNSEIRFSTDPAAS